MRTVQVDSDHVARYERVAKGVYKFTVAHAATSRPVLDGNCRAQSGELVEDAVAHFAARALAQHGGKRDRASSAFANGKPVPNAPHLPPAQVAARIAGDLDISADIPVRLIRDAFRAVSVIDGESMDSQRSRQNHAALDMGHRVLISAPDSLILAIARGEMTLTGSLRAGVTVVRVAA